MKTGMVLVAVLTLARVAWGGDFAADEPVSWSQPAAGTAAAESQQRSREERLLRQLEAAERRAEAAERRAAEAAGALRAEEEGGVRTGVSSPSSVPERNVQLSPESLREERLWQQLEAAERRVEAAEEALRAEEGYDGGNALSPLSLKTIGNMRGNSFDGSKYGTVEVPAWVKSLWQHLKDMEYGFGLMGGYWNTKEVGYGGVMLKLEVDPSPQLGVEMRFGAWESGKKTTSAGNGTEVLRWGDVLMAELGVLGKLPRGKVTLLGGGGGGFYQMRHGEVYVYSSSYPYPYSESVKPYEFGAYAFGGLEFALSPNVSLLGEVRYTWLRFNPKAVGYHDLNLDGLGATIGMTFWLR